MIKEYQENRGRFREALDKLRDDFIGENKVVSVGDRVIGEGYDKGEFEITRIKLKMSLGGAFTLRLPMLLYYGKPISKQGKAMKSRVETHLRYFTTPTGKKYEFEQGFIGEELP